LLSRGVHVNGMHVIILQTLRTAAVGLGCSFAILKVSRPAHLAAHLLPEPWMILAPLLLLYMR